MKFGFTSLPPAPFGAGGRRWWRIALLAVALAGAAPRPADAGLFSVNPREERKIGEKAAREIESKAPIVTGPVADWVSAIGQRLVAVTDPEFQYSFKVIHDDQINAFCLPGGYVYVYTGLRKVVHNDNELAAVMAHEITHAEQHHYARQYAKNSKRDTVLGIFSMVVGLPDLAWQAIGVADYAVTQHYSRGQEEEADHLGMLRMVRAGFDPNAMVSLLDNLSKEDESGSRLDRWFGDHPDGPARVANAKLELAGLPAMQAANDPLVHGTLPPWRGITVEMEQGSGGG